MIDFIEEQFSRNTVQRSSSSTSSIDAQFNLNQPLSKCMDMNQLSAMMLIFISIFTFGNTTHLDDDKFFNNRFYNFAVLKRYGHLEQSFRQLVEAE